MGNSSKNSTIVKQWLHTDLQMMPPVF